MKDIVHVHALLYIVCIVQMLASAWNTSEINEQVKLGEKGGNFWHSKLQTTFVQESRIIITLTLSRD